MKNNKKNADYGTGPNHMLTKNGSRPAYDLPTAVTFLFAGLAVGWILALLFSPVVEDSVPRRTAWSAGSGRLPTSTTSLV